MKKLTGIFLIVLIALRIVSCHSNKEFSSAVFEWDKLPVRNTSSGELRKIYDGPTRSLDNFEVKAVTVDKGKDLKSYSVKNGTDELIIMKNGLLDIAVNNQKTELKEGDVMVVYQGDIIEISNTGNSPATYFSFLFDPKGPEPENRLQAGSLPKVVKWDSLDFRENENGGRRDLMREPTTVLKELEIHATTLKAGASSHSGHNHPDEEIVLMRLGNVDETINDLTLDIGPGSMMFLTNDDVHGVSNLHNNSMCEYYAFRWLTEE